MRKSILYSIVIVLFVLSFSACPMNETPPYVVSVPQCLVGSKESYYQFAGIEFEFLNASDKTISAIHISCRVYDAETERNPFIGSNQINVSFDENIEAGVKKKLIITLDPYIYNAPEEPYLIDFFYIAKIEYADGSKWEDAYGTYHVSNRDE
ncbi:MAG: hypothetical protein LBM77_05040 [Spirochaetaceae bacterium]|jgi:hypothetical protein|nr:hypothetical protein [Spirochaetaceae bacterium]